MVSSLYMSRVILEDRILIKIIIPCAFNMNLDSHLSQYISHPHCLIPTVNFSIFWMA
jgi:hypothetical protein